MANEEIKTTEKNPLEIIPEGLEQIKPLVKPAMKGGRIAGNFLSDVIDFIVDGILK